ncbi:uncharacterized protein LOC125271850 [Megalobrama amblycephala]|uniref:uncharacterized protein LOC125271850 n=1 Tax=Megalobrama amblycephala TaxID=75352 RepID=UPI002013E639|nr:uncharacterized protein LOC125271850 [Megalobrama amblycephala]
MVSTLNELHQLKKSSFGQPRPPRHGLNLLYWFAHDYIDFSNGEIVLNFRPEKGEFGFHKYQNRIEDDEDNNIVPTPTQNFPYYEVGNLNFEGADKLPNYVRGNDRNIPDGNKDRIIVRLDANGRLNRVYVTEHTDPKRFGRSRTFRVSEGLLKIIKNMRKEKYLTEVSNTDTRDIHGGYKSSGHRPNERAPENDSWWCAIL